jgi:hypothetical protein
MGIFAILASIGCAVSFSQYSQWSDLQSRESDLDGLITARTPGQSTTTAVLVTGKRGITNPITLYEDGEISY